MAKLDPLQRKLAKMEKQNPNGDYELPEELIGRDVKHVKQRKVITPENELETIVNYVKSTLEENGEQEVLLSDLYDILNFAESEKVCNELARGYKISKDFGKDNSKLYSVAENLFEKYTSIVSKIVDNIYASNLVEFSNMEYFHLAEKLNDLFKFSKTKNFEVVNEKINRIRAAYSAISLFVDRKLDGEGSDFHEYWWTGAVMVSSDKPFNLRPNRFATFGGKSKLVISRDEGSFPLMPEYSSGNVEEDLVKKFEQFLDKYDNHKK